MGGLGEVRTVRLSEHSFSACEERVEIARVST